MTTRLPAIKAESREAGDRRPGLLPRAFAVFLALHGLVHLVGFTVPFGLGGPKGVTYHTTLLNNSIEVGDTGAKLMGFVWLAAAIAFVAVAVLIWRGHRLALPATVATVIGSLILCAIGLPNAGMGLVIDVALLGLIAFASEKLVGRPARRAVR